MKRLSGYEVAIQIMKLLKDNGYTMRGYEGEVQGVVIETKKQYWLNMYGNPHHTHMNIEVAWIDNDGSIEKGRDLAELKKMEVYKDERLSHAKV